MQDEAQPLEDVSKAGGKNPTQKGSRLPDDSSFKQYMEEGAAQSSGGVTPMELSKTIPQIGSPTLESVKGQFQNASSLLNDVNNKLNIQGMQFKRAEQSLLQTKLSDANNHLRAVSEKLGNSPEKLEVPSITSPVSRFIAYVTDGQKQLAEAQSKLQSLGAEGQIRPEQLLLIQIKLSQAQQELEYSSVVLAKVIDFLKQTMNIQI